MLILKLHLETFNSLQSSTLPLVGTRTFSISLGTGQLSYLSRNKHFLRIYFQSRGISWTDVPTEMLQKTEPLYYVYLKDLVTITAADEAKIAGAQALAQDGLVEVMQKQKVYGNG
jgi:hypothetical protein